ncbi:hypothetical protein B0H66DRAFT_51581 [Apodospora peruviana]|uniref:mRNA export factor MEX67 n=1 Tax=Apodospora peruviana TaxID=516989 RepID=A0AAE0MFD5_9PEZI|nr:hypothetical protein B0H66DRAFT_51581 [Apodospora peruviana]
MAPPTGPRGGTSRPGPARTTRGGGISKRRHNPIKTDRDGDVAMDAAVGGPGNGKLGTAGRGRGNAPRARGGSAPRGSTRASSRIAQNLRTYGADQPSKSNYNRAVLKVLGLKSSKAATNPDGGLRGLLEFLERKASKDKAITIGKNIIDGDYVWINVSKADVPDLLHLNGYSYAGGTLTITETTERMPTADDKISNAAEETKQKLNAVLAKRYNPEARLLDLSALGADDILSSMGTFGSQSLAEKAFKALMILASSQYKRRDEKKEALQAVSIARNDINDVDQVFQLAISLPDLRRLDLSGNNLDSLSKISKWKNRFHYLEELHLTGNPVVNQENYAMELLQWFPSLSNLNGQTVRTPEEVAAALKALDPTPLPQYPSNIRDGGNNVAAIFLQNFFPMFDNDRARLASEFYDSDSWFSLAVIPNSGRPLPWKSYLKYSRNVQRFGGGRNPALMQRLFTGGSLIADMWKILPPTRHPALDQPGQWLIDSHTFPHLADPSGHGSAMGLIITVNGVFEEADASASLYGTRTFTRTFTLGPSKPSNPPPQHPYRVISDQLMLHDWKPQVAIVEQTPTVVAPVPAVGPVLIDDALKLQMTQELSKRTGMTAEYSGLCLSGPANWNFDLALKSFEEQKAVLPPAAFINGVPGPISM